jgi:hypothetical protein
MKHRPSGHLSRIAATLLCVPMLGIAWGQDADPPDRAARLSYVQGDVSVQPAGVQAWSAAQVNRPLTTGDKLWTDQNARAELQVGSTAMRLDAMTGFSFLNLNDQIMQIQLTAGTLNVSVPALEPNQTLEIDTPTLALTVVQPGNYRLEVNDPGDVTVVKVSAGEAQVTGAGQSFQVQQQQSVTFTDTGGLTADVATLGAPDDFDEWNLQRDRSEEVAEQQEAPYVSPDMTGYQDLQDYGSWQSVPDYGAVWVPTAVAIGWAPYRFGHWIWVAPWGWTWVDDAPWGFAPFHYGRWAYLSGSWCWVPGPPHVHPVYAPALVGWVGGPHFNVAVGAGGAIAGVAWFPLGPREVYVPGYHASEGYTRSVNLSNTSRINSTYIDAAVRGPARIQYAPNAVTAVPQNVFASAQPVAPHMVRLNAGQLVTGVAGTAPVIAPSRQSVLGAGAWANAPAREPPRGLQNRIVVAKTPPPPSAVPFDAQRQAIQTNGGRPLAPAQLSELQPHPVSVPVRSATLAPPRVDRPAPPAEFSEQPARSPLVLPERGPRTDRPPSAASREERAPEVHSYAPREGEAPPPAYRAPAPEFHPPAAPPPVHPPPQAPTPPPAHAPAPARDGHEHANPSRGEKER